jgi:hypothetical protein
MNNNQKGFSVVEVVLIVVILALIGTVGWLVYKNHHKSSAASVTACGSVTTDWTPCRNTKGNFIASFPTPSQPLPQTIFSQNGVNYTINGVQSAGINGSYEVIYNVSYLTFPANSTPPSLASLLDNHLRPFQDITIVSSNSNTVSGNKTETYDITATQNSVKYDLTGKIVQVGKVVYRIEAINAYTQAPNAQRFINSFSVGS